jgi:hypothetical protein
MKNTLRFTLATLLVAISASAFAATTPVVPRPVVIELFTSQACSDCPPAEALLRQLQATHPGVLTLAMHVSYFNGPAWHDPFSSQTTTQRQRWYASLSHSNSVFTPQAVIDGHVSAVGSDRSAILQAIDTARPADASPPLAVTITKAGAGWHVSVNGPASIHPATIELIRYDTIDHTAVSGGENGGRQLTEIHVVRAITPLEPWTGTAFDRTIAAGAGQHIAVLAQQNDGTILGAAAS